MDFNKFQQIISNVSHETYLNLYNYVDLLKSENQSLNLIGSSTEEIIWERHIIDSMQLMNFIDNKDSILFDVGSGAGLPGVILSIAGLKHVYLVESKKKKISFLQKASCLSPNKITIVHDRIENVEPVENIIFTCRAFAPLTKIFTLCEQHLEKAKLIILPKGENYMDEIKSAKKQWNFNFSEHKTVTSDKSKILLINDIKCK